MTRIRPAAVDERAAVRNVIDGAGLALDHDLLERALVSDDVLVATAEDGGVVLGALVLDGERIRAVAVRRRRRGQGIGTALVTAAARRQDRLVATFDPALTQFWTSVDFEVVDRREGRRRAVR